MNIYHLEDELATIKGKVIRVLTSEVRMLDDALYALRVGKTHVTEDHIERVIDALRKLKRDIK